MGVRRRGGGCSGTCARGLPLSLCRVGAIPRRHGRHRGCGCRCKAGLRRTLREQEQARAHLPPEPTASRMACTAEGMVFRRLWGSKSLACTVEGAGRGPGNPTRHTGLESTFRGWMLETRAPVYNQTLCGTVRHNGAAGVAWHFAIGIRPADWPVAIPHIGRGTNGGFATVQPLQWTPHACTHVCIQPTS